MRDTFPRKIGQGHVRDGDHESGVALNEVMVIPAIGPLRCCSEANLSATYFCVGDLGVCNGSEQALVCTAP